MNFKTLSAMSGLMLAACNQTPYVAPAPDNGGATADSSKPTQAQEPAQPQPAAPGPGDEQRFTRVAECSSTMRAVARLYGVLAGRESGARRDDLMQRANSRAAASSTFRDMAVALGGSMGRTAADVDRIAAASDQEIQEAANSVPFEQFASRAATEADRCAQLMQGG